MEIFEYKKTRFVPQKPLHFICEAGKKEALLKHLASKNIKVIKIDPWSEGKDTENDTVCIYVHEISDLEGNEAVSSFNG